MEVGVHPFHVCQRNFFSQYHFVESSDKERIKESAVENGQPHHSADEFEVIEMFWIDPRMRIDLQGIIVVGGIFKQTIEWIKHLVGKKEEKLPEIRLERITNQTHGCNHLERPP